MIVVFNPLTSHDPARHEPVLWHDESECTSSNDRPDFAAVDDARRDSVLDPLQDACRGLTSQEGLHTEEVAVKDRREHCLLYDHFSSDRTPFRCVVPVSAKVHEPMLKLGLRIASTLTEIEESYHLYPGIEAMAPIVNIRNVLSGS